MNSIALPAKAARPISRVLLDALLAPRVAILAAVGLSLPAIRTGLLADDLWQRAMLLHEGGHGLPASAGPLSLFTFVSGDPTEHARAVEVGLLPWWSTPGLRFSLFRPIASLTHALDYALWPESPAAMHVQSILWYALVLVLANALYRRWLGPLSTKCAAVATLFYALDPAHGLPVGWIANRNALVSTAFAFAALLLHDTGARVRARVLPAATALALALALGAGESGVAVIAFLGAHAVFLDDRPRRARVVSLLPAGAVVLAWAAIYRLGHFGVAGSGVYRDPVHAPLAFARAVATNTPLLLASELGLSPDAWPAVPFAAKLVMLAAVIVAIVCAALAARRALFAPQDKVRRTARFLLTAGVLSVLPGTAAFPSGRLVLIPGLALIGLLALICSGVVRGVAPRVERLFARAMWFVHLVLAPLLFVLTLSSVGILNAFLATMAAGIPTDPSVADKRLVVIDAPDTMVPSVLLADLAHRGSTPPERLLVLSSDRRPVHITRSNERTLLVHEDGGFARTGTEILFCDPRAPLAVGSTIALSDVIVTVTHTTADGAPDEAAFEFTKPLDEAYVFRKWEGDHFAAVEL